MKNLEYFMGKVCTIITSSTNLPLKDPLEACQYFTGQVVQIDESYIWVKHLNTGRMGCFIQPVIGIVEEQTIQKDDPSIGELKNQVTKYKKPIATSESRLSVLELQKK